MDKLGDNRHRQLTNNDNRHQESTTTTESVQLALDNRQLQPKTNTNTQQPTGNKNQHKKIQQTISQIHSH
jgi:hypothetical protein